MTLRINTNIAALKSVRNLEDADRKLADSLQRLSSGFKINKGSDNPAGLVVSEQLRGQIVGLNQAIANAELATSMVQTTEGALSEVNNLLIRMRQLALQANNEGTSDPTTLQANQQEIEDALDTIARVAKNTQFGNRTLLDGSGGISGEALGEGLTFISGTVNTRTSPVEGYVVNVEQVPTRSVLQGSTGLDEDNLPGLQLTLFEGGRTFQASSSVDDILSSEAGVLEAAEPGQDIAGTINGEAAVGSGQLLRGLVGNENTEGLVVRYAGPRELVEESGPGGRPVFARRPETGVVGVVNVFNNALQFQVGANPGQTTVVALPQINPAFLARDVENASNFQSLADIRVDRQQGARDSIRMIDSAIDQLTLLRGRLGAFQKNGLESNIANLRVTAENLTAAESVIRDADLAKELVAFTKNKLLFDAGSAAVAQANALPKKVISLLS